MRVYFIISGEIKMFRPDLVTGAGGAERVWTVQYAELRARAADLSHQVVGGHLAKL